MNIHFSDEKLYRELLDATLIKIEFGSSTYGTSTEDSDRDIMHIIAEPNNMASSFLWDANQLQYKADSEDHIFTTIDKFMMNLFTGDSVVNFEMIHSKTLRDTPFQFLYDNRSLFYNYSTIRAYLGFARKDCKMYRKNNKKVGHALRSIHFAKSIIAGNLELGLPKELVDEILRYKRNEQSANHTIISGIMNEIDSLRDSVNRMFEENKINRYASVENITKVDQFVYDLKHSNEYLTKAAKYNMDMSYFYEAIENGIEY